MRYKGLSLLIFLIISILTVQADSYVPDFNSMKILKCYIDETIYEQDGTQVTTNSLFKQFRIDDENQKIYLQKAPVDRILYFDDKTIEIVLQTLTDDSIISEKITINRIDGTYTSNSQITYDSPFFSPRNSKSEGNCKFVN